METGDRVQVATHARCHPDVRAVNLSVIVPAYNEAKVLAASLAAIEQAFGAAVDAGWTYELIVCDNNSTDSTADIAQAAGARVVFEPINQISRARNAGAAVARGAWLVFVDADSHPSKGLVKTMLDAMRSGRHLAGGSTIAFAEASLSTAWMARGWNTVSRTMRWAAGSFVFCEADAFRAVGGFSTVLFAAEEIDLFRRLKRLAKARRRRVLILSEHPLLTSSRKVSLYSWREVARFLIRTVLHGGRTLRNAKECFVWYDGRR
ncbi:MAG: glycosyltransferase [Vicinamibacterales bacterium]